MLEQPEASPVDEILDAVFDSIASDELSEAILGIIDKRFGAAVSLWKDQEEFVQNEIRRALGTAFEAMASSLNVSDGWLRLTVQSGDLHATFNLLDHIDEGINAAADFQGSAEDVAETVSGLNEFIAKLEQLRDSFSQTPASDNSEP